MNNWKYRFAQWMQGRYGMDPLYKGLLGLYLVLLVANLFLASPIIMYLSLAVLVFAIYRVFSRNLAKRAAENRRYLALFNKAKKWVLLQYNRIREYKTHRYRKCPSCKTTLRLSKKTGTMTVKCPKCHNSFETTIR